MSTTHPNSPDGPKHTSIVFSFEPTTKFLKKNFFGGLRLALQHHHPIPLTGNEVAI